VDLTLRAAQLNLTFRKTGQEAGQPLARGLAAQQHDLFLRRHQFVPGQRHQPVLQRGQGV